MFKKFIFILICLLFSIKVFAVQQGVPVANTIATIPLEVKAENNPYLEFFYYIYIENIPNGTITKYNKFGENIILGKVLVPAYCLKDSKSFWAAHYIRGNDNTASAVDAIGVNSIHISVNPNNKKYQPAMPDDWLAMIFSLAIKEDYDNTINYNPAVIYTDISGGEDLFGGDSAPFVGNPVQYLTPDNKWDTLDNYFNNDFNKPLPSNLRIVVTRPYTKYGYPDYIEFENWTSGNIIANQTMLNNGRVLLHYSELDPIYIADVLQRVSATGRFIGSEYAGVGRIRANHGGGICLSTGPHLGNLGNGFSRHNERGGFQIIPANHGKFLHYNLGLDFINKEQYLIVGPKGINNNILKNVNYVLPLTPTQNVQLPNDLNNYQISVNPFWEGVAPLFSSYIQPHKPNSWQPSVLNNYNYFLVSEDFGKTWQECPVLQSINSTPRKWTNIRIYLQYDRGLLIDSRH